MGCGSGLSCVVGGCGWSDRGWQVLGRSVSLPDHRGGLREDRDRRENYLRDGAPLTPIKTDRHSPGESQEKLIGPMYLWMPLSSLLQTTRNPQSEGITQPAAPGQTGVTHRQTDTPPHTHRHTHVEMKPTGAPLGLWQDQGLDYPPNVKCGGLEM